jgi:hypothetical protein
MVKLVMKFRSERFFSIRCLLQGHDDMMAREPERLRLRCNHCGRETSGWPLARSRTAREARSASMSFAAARHV